MKRQIGDYRPTLEAIDRALAYWMKKGRNDLCQNMVDQIEQFRAHHLAHGKKMESWDMAWTTWYANAVKFNAPPKVDLFKAMPHQARESYRAKADEPRANRPRSVAEILRSHGHHTAAQRWKG